MPVVTDLSVLGWSPDRGGELPPGSLPARVTRVDRGQLSVLTADGNRCVTPGTAVYGPDGALRPAVGDWVALRGARAVALLPRTGAGGTSALQVIAANIDVVLVVDALVGDTRLRRVERYLAVAWSSGATPV